MWRNLTAFVMIIAVSVGVLHASAQSADRAAPVPSASQREREMVSWVVLSNTHVELTVDSLRKKLDEIYPGEFLTPREAGTFVVEGSVPGQFLIKSGIANAAGVFLLHSVPGPYTEFSGFARKIKDRSMRRQAVAQCCWLSVDLLGRVGNNADAYRFIGRVLAALAPADAAFLVDPETRATVAFDQDLRVRLGEGLAAR